MGVSVTVYGRDLRDVRFRILGTLLRTSWFDALGRVTAVWSHTTEKQTELLPEAILNGLGERRGFGALMVEAGLGRREGDEIWIDGALERMSWYGQKVKAGKASGKARKATDRSNGRSTDVRSPVPTHGSTGVDQKHQKDPTPEALSLVSLAPSELELEESPSGDSRRAALDPPAPKGWLFVFHEWVRIAKKPRSKPTKDRERRVKARLAEGWKPEDLVEAVQGNQISPFHMGDNKDGRVWDDLELICRDSKHVEEFIAIARGEGKPISHNERAIAEGMRMLANETKDGLFPEDIRENG